MKLSVICAALLIAAVTSVVALSGHTALAQQSPCQANPSPVDAANPAIIVSSPTANASVTSPIHVAGQALVFEAVVSIRVLDANGATLAETTTNAAEGTSLSPFSADVPVSVTASTPACLWVFEASAQDGSPRNVVQVPLTITPAALPNTGTGDSSTMSVFWLATGLAIVGGLALGGGTGLALRARRQG